MLRGVEEPRVCWLRFSRRIPCRAVRVCVTLGILSTAELLHFVKYFFAQDDTGMGSCGQAWNSEASGKRSLILAKAVVSISSTLDSSQLRAIASSLTKR